MEAETTQSTDADIKILDWLYTNRKILVIITVAAIVIALIAGIIAWQRSAAETAANTQLLGVPLITVRTDQIIPAPPAPLLAIARQYPDTSSGEYAALLAGQALFNEEKYPEAHQEFAKFVEKYPASLLLPQAKVGVAASLEGEGKIPEATQQYQQILAAYSSDAYVILPIKLTLARLEEVQNKPELALGYYEELARINDARDPWVAEARERGQILLLKHPELRKQPPSSAAAPGAMRSSAPPTTALRTPSFKITNSSGRSPTNR